MMPFFKYLNRIRQSLHRPPQRPRRPQPFRTRPTVEALEDRLVMDAAFQIGHTLFIDASLAGFVTRRITVEVDKGNPTKLDVFHQGPFPPSLLGQFTIASINKVQATVAGNDAIIFDNSNGFPLAFGTSVFLGGSGGINQLVLQGNQAINTQEAYTAGFTDHSGAQRPGSLVLGGSIGVQFQFTSAISFVTDVLANSGVFNVNSAISQNVVTLNGFNGVTEQLDGLSNNDTGGALTFGGKGLVLFDIETNNAFINLDATAAAKGLKGFTVDVGGTNDTLNIFATPSTAQTEAVLFGQFDRVNLLKNSDVVSIFGFHDPTTSVLLGSNPFNFGTSVTSDIKADVFVSGVGKLQVVDSGNAKTSEIVKVTESTVSDTIPGTGLFGNNGVVLHYSSTFLILHPGQLANMYTVAPSHIGARFSSPIFINDVASLLPQHIDVSVDPGSALNLTLLDTHPAVAHLFISAPGGTLNPTKPTISNGKETVTFKGGLTSTVTYFGFDDVV
jgi:hypothetical protein